MDHENSPELPVLPVVRQPTGLKYYLGTWSGRILLFNFLIFALMVLKEPSSFWIPSVKYVREFGSKSLADIALGEYWRFVTPVFVHIGVVHFFFNAMALYYIGYQIEYILGARWFLALYFSSGVVGNLASCLFSLAPSAGASGALFGLLGAGFRLEGLLSDAFDQQGLQARPRKRIYSGLVITNIILGLIIPVIDNAAHIGGLVTGWLLMECMLRTKPNRLRRRNVKLAGLIWLGISLFSIFSILTTTSRSRVGQRYFAAAIKAESAPEAYLNFSEAIRINPLDEKSRFYRGSLLLKEGETEKGIDDVRIALSTGKVSDRDFDRVLEDLEMTGHPLEAEIIRKLKEEIKSQEI